MRSSHLVTLSICNCMFFKPFSSWWSFGCNRLYYSWNKSKTCYTSCIFYCIIIDVIISKIDMYVSVFKNKPIHPTHWSTLPLNKCGFPSNLLNFYMDRIDMKYFFLPDDGSQRRGEKLVVKKSRWFNLSSLNMRQNKTICRRYRIVDIYGCTCIIYWCTV